MASDSSAHRRVQTTPQSIPLQDLGNASPVEDGPVTETRHRRTLSERGRRLFARGGLNRRSGRYTQLLDDQSLSRDNRTSGLSARQVSHEIHSDPPQEYDESGAASPLIDGGSFQEAMGFAGLSFTAHVDDAWRAENLPHDPGGLSTMTGYDADDPSLADVEADGSGEHTPTLETDRTPLTNFPPSSPSTYKSRSPGQRHDRLSTQSVRFVVPSSQRTSPRLGDDLAAVEADIGSPGSGRGRKPGSHNRSLSPSSANNPLQRAGTIVRDMSQRVVNISNEPELVQQELRRRKVERTSDPIVADAALASRDGTNDEHSSASEKPSLQGTIRETHPRGDWTVHANPLRGKSLGMIPANSRLRTRLCALLVHPITEPTILVLIMFQTVLLAVEDASNWNNDPRPRGWRNSWFDYTFLILFIIYTIEIVVRTIVSGFVVNPIEYSSIHREIGLKRAVEAKAQTLFALHREPSLKQKDSEAAPQQPSILRAFTSTSANYLGNMDHDPRHPHRVRLAHRAFLRHGFNRLDFVAVVSYWISFIVAVSGLEASQHIHAFRMLSSLRILRLLSLTKGTSIILRSLKKAAPLLLNVALLISFFWLLFAIVGVQSFKSSLRRSCVWVDPEPNVALRQANWTTNSYGNYQFCGGSLNANGSRSPWTYADGTSSGSSKGYLCPPNSYCVSTLNPYGGTVSFDNILQSLQLVFVTMTSNTFTDILYYLADSDYLAAALFFASGIVVLTFWLVNLLIAVITSSFQVIREESQNSAFMANERSEELDESEVVASKSRPRGLKYWFSHTYWFWIAVIGYGLICQTLRSANMGSNRRHFIDVSETVVTLVLLVEIILRFAADWRHFFLRPRNLVDLGLVVITTIIQLPPIHSSGQPYAWLTIFQILRIYRVVLAVPWTRDLILLVLGKVSGILNLIVFVFLLTFLGAIFASQLFRGEVPSQDPSGNNIQVSFFSIYNSFLGMYQVLSSENWTTLMYNVTMFDVGYNTGWIGAVFFIMWITLAYFIVLNMFIAVIQENFDVSEDEKRLQQVKAFLQQKELGASSHSTLSLSSMFRLRSLTSRRQDPLDYGPAMKEMLLKDAVVRDFLDEETMAEQREDPSNGSAAIGKRQSTLSLQGDALKNRWNRLVRSVWDHEPNPFHSDLQFTNANEELNPQALARDVFQATEQRKRAQRDYLIRYPNYNVSLFIFKADSPIRRMCQKFVGPGRGSERFEGAPPSPLIWYAFSAFLYAVIVAMVLLACVTTPIYQREYWKSHTYSVDNWFVFTDLAFAALFTVEAVVRLIADGLFWTPNAYFRSSWGFIDGVVLITLWINVITSLYKQGAVSRAVGAFKALRALRLLNVSDSARDTFHSVIVRGGWKILSAAFVSLSLLIPFAIYGLNLFNGKMETCNDGNPNMVNLTNCVNEYLTSPTSNWNVLAPRQVSNPWFSFDNFGDSLYILFSIVSQEGWINVMWNAISITGRGLQPQPFASQGNAVFFVIFNLLGAVFVLTLFVSVFMRNYTEQTGVAFLTTEQRAWLELRKLLRQMSPSKRPAKTQMRETWQQWCYRRAVRKTGRWQRLFTVVLMFHLALLCLEWYPDNFYWERTRDYMFLVLTLFYICNIVVRIIGLTWTRFRRRSWDLFSLVSVSGTFITTVLLLSNFEQKIYVQLHKLFLVSIVLLLIPRNNQLDQLFKTAAASLTAIANLMATWFVIFLVFAIAFTQTFGLTRFGSNETDNINFRDVPKALILLFRMSVGEGWNQIMQDYATINPPFCNPSDNFLDDDCGSTSWALTLFILWNIISMYIFVNMFVSLIYESFAYVYQRSSGLSVISRKEIRNFKQAWAELDPQGTGYISKECFPRFLGELSGVFEMRIYPQEFTVGALKEDCKISRPSSNLPIDEHSAPVELDLRTLNARLRTLPVEEIQRRRNRLNVFYEEVMVSADPDRGISFTSLLMILAHYKLISDNKSLRLEEFLRRRARLQRVEEAVRRSIVVSFFDTLFWSRRFRRHMDAKRAGRITEVPQLQVPEIFVEDEDNHTVSENRREDAQPRPSLSLQIPVLGQDQTQVSGNDVRSGSQLRNRSDSIQISPGSSPAGHSPKASLGSQRWPSLDISRDVRLGVPGDDRRSSDHSEDAESTGRVSSEQATRRGRSRANSNVSARDMLETFDQSAWGESIRRSFTIKRGGSPGSVRRSDGT
ncbi:MAG: calcium channel protein [Chrysothrix sp. TS-e1954]|nr:MAG: calcium channel protein [Chrysothrix sp. TS-e1954]